MSRLICVLLCLALVASYSHVSADQNSAKPVQDSDLPVDVEDAEHVALDSDDDDDDDGRDDEEDDDDDDDDEDDDDEQQVRMR
jgi:hypothetical protein